MVNNLYFVIYFLCCWRWKRKFLNKFKRSLVTIWVVIIFSPTMRQEGGGWNADKLVGELVYNYYSDAQVFETFEWAKCFGVFLVNFCATKVKGTTNILTSALRYRRYRSVARATFFCSKRDLFASHCLDFERAKIRRHARYTNRWAIAFGKPAIRMCILKNSGKQGVNWQDTDRGVLLWLPACMCMLMSLMLHFVGEKAGDAGCQGNISHVTVIKAR